jgi:nickel-dependent lactate racemase
MQEVQVRVNEHFGDELLPLAFPEGWKIERVNMECTEAELMKDEEIREALMNTIGSENIKEQAKGKRGKIVITCDDLSRPTPADRVFPFIIEQLHEAGIGDDQIFVLGSFGCHHPMNLDDFARKLGDWVVAKYDCVNHNPHHNFENLGRTSMGTPLLVNKEFASADLRIAISGVKKHVWAGAGGGGKAIIPGVSSSETILFNHSIISGARGSGDRRIWWIKDNPERRDMQEAARLSDLNVSINCIYNHERKLIDLYAGNVDDAWKEGVKNCYEAHSCKSPEDNDIVIVNAYPQADQDIDWWGAQDSLREGGTAVAVHHFTAGSALLHYRSEMMGNPWQRMESYPNRRWPVKQANNIIVYTNRPSKRQKLRYDDRVEWMNNWESVVERLTELHGSDASVSLYPVGKIQFNKRKNKLDI